MENGGPGTNQGGTTASGVHYLVLAEKELPSSRGFAFVSISFNSRPTFSKMSTAFFRSPWLRDFLV